MQIQKPYGSTKKRKIVGHGRSSGRGKTCGRGQKGQHARNTVRLGFEGGQMPLYRRIARRGFSNYPFRQRWGEVSISVIDTAFNDGDVISLDTLKTEQVIRKNVNSVKILSNGVLTKKIEINDIRLKLSKAAAEQVLTVGGKITLQQPTAAKEPVVAKKPDGAKEPAVAKEPDGAKEPVVAKKPDGAKEPAVAKEPDGAKESAVVKEPKITEESKED